MSDESFAALFEAQSKEAQVGHRKVRVGEMLQAAVVQVDKETIFIELDAKRQAMLDLVEMPDAKVGDIVRARVVSVDPASGEVRLGLSFGKTGDIAQIEQARSSGVAIEGKVTGVNKGGIEIDLGKGLRGFCPTSQIAMRGDAVDAKDLVGQSLAFQVTEIKDGGRNIVLSRRKALEADARDGREAALAALEVGKVVRGKVTAVRDFGAFVDIGGIEGLIPGARDRVTAGEMVDVEIVEIKDDDEKKQKRITLSLASQAGASEKVATKPGAKLDIGSIVQGRVVRIESYGVFLQVNGTEGRDGRGLVPLADLDVARGADLRKAFPENTVLTAKVVENGGGRLKLSVKGAREATERAEYEAHRTKAQAPESLGTFADLLKKK